MVAALLERRCAGATQAEAGEAAGRVLLDNVLAAAAAAALHLQQQLLWPLRAVLQRQALSWQSRLSGPACSLCLLDWLTQELAEHDEGSSWICAAHRAILTSPTQPMH